MLEKYFPRGVAEGEAFIGREKELKWLVKNIHLSKQSSSQIKLLTLIASGKKKALTSKPIQIQLNLSSSALTKALQLLEERDYIEKLDEGYRIIDPLIKDVLLEFEQTNI